ncbi:TlpA family protein disulfide reductase [Pirellulales bacterium]|nr:TlpA family protein disulfide reductase [Pirellulales bacterium]MDB4365871.1 TlpA family protein disulfide reductase [Pirellulales bacterium]
MTRNVWFLKQLLLFAGAISVVGCGWYGDKPADRVASQPVQQQKSKPVSVVIVDHSEIMKRIASHRGKIVVLDCWSTSCPPCVREFPGLVTLQKEYGDSVVCLSLSFDYEGFGVPEDVLPPVQKFLEQVSAGSIENLLNRDGADSLYTKMNLTSVPVVMVWDRDGTMVQQFDDDYANKKLGRAFTYDDVRQVINQVTQSKVKE